MISDTFWHFSDPLCDLKNYFEGFEQWNEYFVFKQEFFCFQSIYNMF